MSFFRNFPFVDYQFGDEIDPAVFQNITAYIDIVDQVKDDISVYEKFQIRDNVRPETLSYEIYGTPDYYWMFYLLNDNLRQQGWPLSEQEIYTLGRQYYPNTVLATTRSMHGEAAVGTIVYSPNDDVNPTFKAKVLEKKYDMGQIVVKPIIEVRSITVTSGGSGYTSIPTVTISGGSGEGATAVAAIDEDPLSDTYKQVTAITVTEGGDDYTAAPTITISDPNEASGTKATATATLSTNNLTIPVASEVPVYSKKGSTWEPLYIHSSEYQYNAHHHYEDANGNWVDLNYIPDNQYGVNSKKGEIIVGSNTISGWQGKTVVTYLERLRIKNDELRSIKIFTPSIANQINTEFQKLLKQ